MSRRVLIIFAHPAFEKSRVNARLLAAARTVEGVTVHDLYEAAPDFSIDVKGEQKRLLEADVIVFQHPLFWYSVPALLKEWLDLVLAHGWAYGSHGTALRGKLAVQAVTAGGPEDSYNRGAFNHFTLRELLAPMDQTCRLCGMHYLAPFAAFGTHHMTSETIDRHAADYRELLSSLVDERVNLAAAERAACLNTDLARVIEPAKGKD